MRRALELAVEGHEILDKRREVLTTELVQLAHEAETLQRQVWEDFQEAYMALEEAMLMMGRERVEWAGLAATESVEVQIRLRSVMGVTVPSVESSGFPPEMTYGLGDTTVSLDEASARFREVLAQMSEYAELVTSVWRLAKELQKTHRRVNALEYIFIPRYESTVRYIENALEEREREETFRLKRIKVKTARPAVGPPRREYAQPQRSA
jgi:V/A-type H+-transporting ATPase subunit D